MSHQEYSLKSKDGLILYAQAWLIDQPARALVILVHGLGEHSGRYAHVAEKFNANAINMFAFDQRGHGKSGGPKGHTPSYQHLMDDITLAIQEGRRLIGDGLPTILYGHSLGALEVLYYGIKQSETLKGFIATSPPLDLSATPESKKKLAKFMNPLFPKLTMPNGLDVNALSRDPAVVKAYSNDPLVHDKISVRLGMFMIDGAETVFEKAASWHYPLLLMHGSSDQICGIKGSEAFVNKTKNGVTCKRWEGLYHETHNEPEKEQVIQAMVDWINAQI